LPKENKDNPVKALVKTMNKSFTDKVTEEDIVNVIEYVSKMHRGKKFAYFTEDDIESQAKLICLQQIKHYEPEKGIGTSPINSLERWLNRVIKNRLANYYRDNYTSVNEKHKESRVNLANCLELDSINTTNETSAYIKGDIQLKSLEYGELVDFIESNLSEQLKDVYHDCLNDENVSSYYKGKLLKEIQDIMVEWNRMNNGEEANKN